MSDGTVRRRGEKHRARYRHPDTGRQYEKTFTTKRAADKWLTDQLAAIDKGRWIDPTAGNVTFGDYYEGYAARQVWATGTVRAMDLAAKSAPFWDTPVGRIRPTHVEAWVKDMSKTLAPGTIKTRLNNVRSVFKAAVRDEVIAVDPSSKITRLPRQRRAEIAMAIPSPEVVGKIVQASDERFVAFVSVCALAGLRLGEAAALQVGDVDFLRRMLHVRRQVQRKGGGEVEITLPKYGSERDVPISDELVQILARHVELGHRGEWLFQGSADRPPHQNTVGYEWRKTIAAAGLEGIRLHDLRHFYASGLIAEGCDVVTVQRALGHSKATTTLNTYSHLWPSGEDKTRKAASALASAVLGANVGGMRAGGDI